MYVGQLFSGSAGLPLAHFRYLTLLRPSGRPTAMQYMLSVFDRDVSTLKIVPLELDLDREHYPPRHQRYVTVAYNFGVTATDKVADTLAHVTPCSPEEARAAATALKKEGAAILLYNDITVSGAGRGGGRGDGRWSW